MIDQKFIYSKVTVILDERPPVHPDININKSAPSLSYVLGFAVVMEDYITKVKAAKKRAFTLFYLFLLLLPLSVYIAIELSNTWYLCITVLALVFLSLAAERVSVLKHFIQIAHHKVAILEEITPDMTELCARYSRVIQNEFALKYHESIIKKGRAPLIVELQMMIDELDKQERGTTEVQSVRHYKDFMNI